MYLSPNNTTFLLILISISMLMNHSNCIPTYNYHVCRDPILENASNSDIFQSELTSLLEILSLAASSKSFYNASISKRLYGLFLCRGDVSAKTCKKCTGIASQEIKSKCVWNSSGVIWYDECMVRYSKENFFGVAKTSPLAFVWNTNDKNRTSPSETHLNAQALMYPLIQDASSRKRRFKLGKSTVCDGSERYGLAQCTRDINKSSCISCLTHLMNKSGQCCQHKVGWRLLAPSCYIRYEKDIFYGDTTGPLISPNTQKPVLPTKDNGKRVQKLLIFHMIIPITSCLLFYLIWSSTQLRKGPQQGEGLTDVIQGMNVTHEDNKGEVQYFSLSTIKVATNSFSDDNKLGEGGFGPVFKGKLSNGKEIAVKRLSFKSRQGIEEFKNEMTLIAKLQHKNLVRILGCCIDRNEKLLVYEYMANTGLDAFLFG
ncbi:hypothetical protein PIB30_064402 [Stylosanthes scabra]|uniref:Cysteine-rich receptor-like protein kinase 25 n=1 Tax=Stylosanthes scabra TaxID=79078 RepID=A0ABU6VL88_9FABA|nr:hypothetical protein [Stylosanthes scabra]